MGTKRFSSMESFNKFLKTVNATTDVRPFTGIWKSGKRIGSYFEKKKKIEVDLY